MKTAVFVRVISVGILFFSAACASSDENPTVSPTTVPAQSQPTIEDTLTPLAAAATESPAPSAEVPATETGVTSTTSPTESVPIFTDTGGVYTVNLTSADFVDVVDNPYFPLPSGAKWQFEIREGGTAKQMDTLEVLREKRNVNGVQATVVRDTVSSGTQIVEDTFDWFVQDKYGNVWYVGEEVDNYIAGVLVNHSGSWEWGVDGALPGIIMWADPSAHVGEKYRQEYYPGKAEDMGQVLSVDESLTVPFGSFDHVVKTLDFSNIEAGQEQKFYAPGIGLLREQDVNGKEEVVLVSFTQP